MDQTTVMGAAFSLKRGSKTVAATLSFNAAGDETTLRTNRPLPRATTYTATVTTGAEDAAGNALAAPKSWRFTTK